LKYQPAAAALLALLEHETDPHVLGDALYGLASLDHAQTPEACRSQLVHPAPIVRRQTLRGLKLWWDEHGASDQTAEILARALNDEDLSVRAVAIELAAKYAPEQAVIGAILAFDHNRGIDRVAQTAWARAIAIHDATFEGWIKQEMPGPERMLFAIAAHRADPRLAAALSERLESLTNDQGVPFVIAAMRQRDQPLAQAVFAKHDDLPASVQTYQGMIQEATFGAQIGAVLSDWKDFHSQLPRAKSK
jgi:hypothetical protein